MHARQGLGLLVKLDALEEGFRVAGEARCKQGRF